MKQPKIACKNCRRLLFDTDIETETIACEKGYFNYTIYPDRITGIYVNIENGSYLCKGKSFISK